MRVDCALLSDATTVREGLLHILGGGITRVTPPSYPHVFVGALALRIMLHPTEAGSSHNLQIVLQDSDGKRLLELAADFQAEAAPDLAVNEEIALPLSLGFSAQLERPGGYSFEVLTDTNHQTTVQFWGMDPT